jgi:FtsP/CotA-like multicopper oxidase with cupredoxin domain
VVHRGEPTSIWVVNRTTEPTAVHWHGIELDASGRVCIYTHRNAHLVLDVSGALPG